MTDEQPHLAGRPVSNNTYTNHGCRCAGCLSAHRDYGRAYREKYPDKERARLARVRQMRRSGRWGRGKS